jgi:hypothetical protein
MKERQREQPRRYWTCLALLLLILPHRAHALSLVELTPLFDRLLPGAVEHAVPFNNDAGALVFPDVVVTLPDGGQLSADALTIAAFDVTALLAKTPPSELDLTITGLVLEAKSVGAFSELPWPFSTDRIKGDVAVRFSADFGDKPRVEASLDIDFGSHGEASIAAILVQPPGIEEPRDPQVPLHGMLPLEIKARIHKVTIPDTIIEELVGSPDIWQYGSLPATVEFRYSMDAAAEQISVAATLALASSAATLEMAGKISAYLRAYPQLLARYGPEALLSTLSWQHAKLAYTDNGLAGALMELVASYQGQSVFYLLAEFLEDLNAVDQELGRPGPAREIVHKLRNLVLAYGTYEGDTLQLALDSAAPFTFEDFDRIRIHPDRGVHPDDMLRLLGVSVTHVPGFSSAAVTLVHESAQQHRSAH